jgi:hypothetical protein
MTEWVAIMTFVDEYAGMFYEEGGLYSHHPHCKAVEGARRLQPGEPVAICPRCGQRFAASAESTPEACRDLHFDGDADIPSICRQLPARRLTVVRGASAVDERTTRAHHPEEPWRDNREGRYSE